MVKGTQKKKKGNIFIAKSILGGGAKLAKNKEKMSKNELLVLIISMCRIYHKMYY